MGCTLSKEECGVSEHKKPRGGSSRSTTSNTNRRGRALRLDVLHRHPGGGRSRSSSNGSNLGRVPHSSLSAAGSSPPPSADNDEAETGSEGGGGGCEEEVSSSSLAILGGAPPQQSWSNPLMWSSPSRGSSVSYGSLLSMEHQPQFRSAFPFHNNSNNQYHQSTTVSMLNGNVGNSVGSGTSGAISIGGPLFDILPAANQMTPTLASPNSTITPGGYSQLSSQSSFFLPAPHHQQHSRLSGASGWQQHQNATTALAGGSSMIVMAASGSQPSLFTQHILGGDSQDNMQDVASDILIFTSATIEVLDCPSYGDDEHETYSCLSSVDAS